MIENLRLSARGIWAHKMRSALTMLGIIIGIASLIAIVSTIKGTNEQIKNNLIGAGTNTVTVQLNQNSWPADFSYENPPEGVPIFNDAVREEIAGTEGVKEVSFVHMRDYCDSMFCGNTALTGTSVFGIDEAYLSAAGYQIVKGRGFGRGDFTNSRKVVLVDETTVRSGFDGEDPIGKAVDINGDPFVVVGVVAARSAFEPVINTEEEYYTFMGNASGKIFIPDQMWPTVFRYDEPLTAVVRADSTDDMTAAGKATEKILNSYLKVSDPNTWQYKSKNLADEAAQLQKLSSSTNNMLIGIALISLLVGGIGIMNIMLVTVTERTREIGIKKALGARKKVILRQFLSEAAMLSSIGGIIGVAAGVLLAKIISMAAQVPTAISIPAILIAVVFSMLVGVIFGLMPSIKASNLNPIDALRYE